MLDPRWRKVLRDLTANRTRTILVIVSIAVGVFAVGTVQHLRTSILQEMQAAYNASAAAQATLFVSEFDEEALDVVRRMPEVAAAEGRTGLSVEVEVTPGRWESMNITPIDDFTKNQVNLLTPIYAIKGHPDFGAERTRWPAKDEIVLERASLDAADALPAGLQVDQTLRLKTPDSKIRAVILTGAVYDPNGFPAAFTGTASGYVDFDTFERLGGTRIYNQLLIRVNGTPEQMLDEEYITSIANLVSDKLERGSATVQRLFVPEPGELIFQNIFDSVSLLLTPLGILALFLSGFLVVNTISALVAQQTRQIGIMKTIGALRPQVIGMYLGAVVVYSVLALLLAIPLTMFVTGAVLQFAGTFINIDFPRWSLPPSVLLLQVAVGLLVPLVAALVPVLRGAAVTVREAIADAGASVRKIGLIDRILARIRGLSRPLQLSLRNTFRRRARLVLTLLMLVLGGMIFMTIGSVRASLSSLIEAGLAYSQYDIQIRFNEPYRVQRIEAAIYEVPGVAEVESWITTLATRQREDGTESNPITMIGLPAESTMVQPTLTAGRWLRPEDENAVVVSTQLLATDSDIEVGKTITLERDGRETPWLVIGVVQVLSGPPNFIPAYANYEYVSRYAGLVMRSDSVQVKVTNIGDATPDEVVARLETALDDQGFNVESLFTINRIRQISGGIFDVIVYLLSAMGVLIATVGALGLMGTMSTNVLERTREIGVMRAIGATDGAIQRIVIVEGVIIGFISWLIGAALAYPIGAVISTGVGQVLFNADLPYTFSSTGVITWFFIVACLAAVASFLPAWNASRLTVREVLAYE
jgi:putative ABC transport system permease protein